MPTRLRKPITRVVRDELVVTIDAEGLTIRGLRKRVRRKRLTWEQVAALSAEEGTIRAGEIGFGRKELQRLGIED